MPQDVMPEAALIHSVDAAFNNTEKPLMFAPDTLNSTRAAFDMTKMVVGESDLSLHPTNDLSGVSYQSTKLGERCS